MAVGVGIGVSVGVVGVLVGNGVLVGCGVGVGSRVAVGKGVLVGNTMGGGAGIDVGFGVSVGLGVRVGCGVVVETRAGAFGVTAASPPTIAEPAPGTLALTVVVRAGLEFMIATEGVAKLLVSPVECFAPSMTGKRRPITALPRKMITATTANFPTPSPYPLQHQQTVFFPELPTIFRS